MRIEPLEPKRLLAIGGFPELIAINPNDGSILEDGQVRDVAPLEFTFRFDDTQQMNPATLDGIQLTRAGFDDAWGDAQDTRIDPVFLEIGENPNEVVMRFAENLPDDLYRFDLIGAGATPLRNLRGQAFNGGANQSVYFELDLGAQIIAVVPQPISRDADGNLVQAEDQIVVYFNNDDLRDDSVPDLTVIGNGGTFVDGQTLTIEDEQGRTVVFEMDDDGDWDDLYTPIPFDGGMDRRDMVRTIADAINGDPILSVSATADPDTLSILVEGDDRIRLSEDFAGLLVRPVSVEDPQFYKLIYTNETVTNADDGDAMRLPVLPTDVNYDPETDTAVLTFEAPLDQLTTGAGTYRLRIGTDEVTPRAPEEVEAILTDPGSSFGTAMDLATEFDFRFSNNERNQATGIIVSSQIDPEIYPMDFPGADDEPGHGPGGHVIGPDADPGITTIAYGFPVVIGQLVGDNSYNIITEVQKLRVREIFEFYGEFLGVQFMEAEENAIPTLQANGIPYFAVAVGDMRNIDPLIDTGPMGTMGLAGLLALDTGLAPGAVMDAAELWDSSFGQNFVITAMHEIGHLLGYGDADLPALTIMNDQAETFPNDVWPMWPFAFDNEPERVFPGDHDITHGQYMYRPESNDIDLYKFEVEATGMFTAETIAERMSMKELDWYFGDASMLDSMLTLYQENIDGTRTLISQNDDYFSEDAYIEMELEPGIYYLGVTAGGNGAYDPVIENTGIGGLTQGPYDLRLNFRPQVDDSIVDATGTALDGDADGVAGGVYNYWFRVAEQFDTGQIIAVTIPGWAFQAQQTLTITDEAGEVRVFEFTPDNDSDGVPDGPLANVDATPILYSGTTTIDEMVVAITQAINGEADFGVQAAVSGTRIRLHGDTDVALSLGFIGLEIDVVDPTTPKTIFVDKSAEPGGDGSLFHPYNNLDGENVPDAAFKMSRPNDTVRIQGNGGADGELATAEDNLAYEIGFDLSGTFQPLSDGVSMEIPRGVTVMVDAGAIFKLRKASVEVGSTAVTIDRSGGVLQVLGTPEQTVYFTSFDDKDVGVVTNPRTPDPTSGNWGGILFRNDLDQANADRLNYEARGIFLNYVNHATFLYGGGNVEIDSVEQTITPIHMTDARPTISFNTIMYSADAAMSANPDSFEETNFQAPIDQMPPGQIDLELPYVPFTADYNRIGPDIYGNTVVDNTTNGLFVRIKTPAGGPLETLTVAGRWDDTDIVHVVAENLVISGAPGGARYDASRYFDPANIVLEARTNARLKIDPQMIVKLDKSFIQTGMGAQLIAEGLDGLNIVFTSLMDDSYGAGGTFDTSNNENTDVQSPGDWAGLYLGHLSNASIDYALMSYGGGNAKVEGSFTGFNTVEIHQAKARIANSVIEESAGGVGGQADRERFGRGFNEPGTIFVRGAQPVIVNNVIRDNIGSAININANSLNQSYVTDWGRSTGATGRTTEKMDNQGPLIRGNRLFNNEINGMEIRGATLNVEGVWDDTDVAHVLFETVYVVNTHSFGGLRLESSATESLVVKLEGDVAGITATGQPNGATDRVGGFVHVVGQPGFPVVMTSFRDDEVTAGFAPDGSPMGDTNNDGNASVPAPGDWRSILLEPYSHDSNLDTILEQEAADVDAPGPNALPSTAQLLGALAPHDKGGDDSLRLGFEVLGFLTSPGDIDVYSFTAEVGTEVWIDLDRTTYALDTVVELINANGQVIARSNNGYAEEQAFEFINKSELSTFADTMPKSIFASKDHFSTNPRDAALRVVLPGPPPDVGEDPLRLPYHVRVRSSNLDKASNGPDNPDDPNVDETTPGALNNGLTRGAYELQIRLQEVDDYPGSTVRYADLRYATNAVEAYGQPIHSPLLGEAAETGDPNDTFATAQIVSGPASTERVATSLAGDFLEGDYVDWYQITTGGHTIFDMDYADGLARSDTQLAVYDESGNLLLWSTDSNVADDRPGPMEGADLTDLNRGTVGPTDTLIGTQFLPPGTYYVAVMSLAATPAALEQFGTRLPANPLLRLEPINSVRRIAEDRINPGGAPPSNAPFTTALPPIVPQFMDVEWTLTVPYVGRIPDGETFVLIDADGVETTFEFDEDFVTLPDNVPVPLDPNGDPEGTAANLAVVLAMEGFTAFISPGYMNSLASSYMIQVRLGTDIVGVSQPDSGKDSVMRVSRPSVVPWNLGDVALFISSDWGNPPVDTSLIQTFNPFTGAWLTTSGTYPYDVGDIALKGKDLFAFSKDVEDWDGPSDAEAGNYIQIDVADASATNLGDDDILTFELDPEADATAEDFDPYADENAIESDVGVHFEGIEFGPATPNPMDRVGWAVGFRGDRLVSPQSVDFKNNILYQFQAETGIAQRKKEALPGYNPILGGASTDVLERGPILTSPNLFAVEATEFIAEQFPEPTDEIPDPDADPKEQTIDLITDGLKIVVENRNQPDPDLRFTTFEFDAGPEYGVRIDEANDRDGGKDGFVDLFVKDGDVFSVQNQLFQFDTGRMLVVTGKTGADLRYGDAFTITDNESNAEAFIFVEVIDPLVEYFETPIELSPVFNAEAIATEIAAAINDSAIDVTAENSMNRISITNARSITFSRPDVLGVELQGDDGEAPVVQFVEPGHSLQLNPAPGQLNSTISQNGPEGPLVMVPGRSIPPGESFTIRDATNLAITFEFSDGNPLTDPNRTPIVITGAPSAEEMAVQVQGIIDASRLVGIRTAVDGAMIDLGQARLKDGDTFTVTTNPTTVTADLADPENILVTFELDFGVTLTLPDGATVDEGETVTVTDKFDVEVTFEFEKGDGIQDTSGSILIPITGTMTPVEVAEALEAAVSSQFPITVPTHLRGSELNLEDARLVTQAPGRFLPDVTIVLEGAYGVAPGNVRVPLHTGMLQSTILAKMEQAIKDATTDIVPLRASAKAVAEQMVINGASILVNLNNTPALKLASNVIMVATAELQPLPEDEDPPATPTTRNQVVTALVNAVNGSSLRNSAGQFVQASVDGTRLNFLNADDADFSAIVRTPDEVGVYYPPNDLKRDLSVFVPRLTITLPAGSDLVDGEKLVLDNQRKNEARYEPHIAVTFEFDSNNSVPNGNPNYIGVDFTNDMTAEEVATALNDAIERSELYAEIDAQQHGNQLNLGSGVVAVRANDHYAPGEYSFAVAAEDNAGREITLVVPGDNLVGDGESITLTDGDGTTVTFEFDSDDTVAAGATRIPMETDIPATKLAERLATAIDTSGLVGTFRQNFNKILLKGIETVAQTAAPTATEAAVAVEDHRGHAGVLPGNERIGFLAEDIDWDIAARINQEINRVMNPDPTSMDGGSRIVQFQNNTNATTQPPLYIRGEGPGGDVTGLARVGGDLYAVSDGGGLWLIENPNGVWRLDNPPGSMNADYIESSEDDLAGIDFAGATAGPPTVEGGRYADMLFASDTNGTLYALNTRGELQPIFLDGATSIETGVGSVQGLAFSNLDRNLWHVTTPEPTNADRYDDPGHGIKQSFDSSRIPAPDGFHGTPNTPIPDWWAGNSSFYFGDQGPHNYDFAGGAHGTLISNPFSLEGYAPEDQPFLYFTYFLETEGDNSRQVPNRDSFRVFASGDDGSWVQLATNKPNPPEDGITLWDGTDTWRQARISLAGFAGLPNIKLRFDFATAGQMNVGEVMTTGSELHIVSAYDIRDGETFTIDAQTFEFDLGYTLDLPAGADVADGERLTLFDDTGGRLSLEFTRDGVVGLDPSGVENVAIPVTDSLTPKEVGDRILTALIESPLTGTEPTFIYNRINFQGIALGNLTQATAPGEEATAIRVVSEPGVDPLSPLNVAVPIALDMGAEQVAYIIDRTLETEFVSANPVIIADDGSFFADGETFTITDGINTATFEFNGSFLLNMPPNGGLDIAEEDTFTITDGVYTARFEFDDDATVGLGSIPVPYAGRNVMGLAAAITQAVNDEAQAAGSDAQMLELVATDLGDGRVQILGLPGQTMGIDSANLTSTTHPGVSPGNEAVDIIPNDTFPATDVAAALETAINNSLLGDNIIATADGRRVRLQDDPGVLTDVAPGDIVVDTGDTALLMQGAVDNFKLSGSILKIIGHTIDVTDVGPLGFTDGFTRPLGSEVPSVDAFHSSWPQSPGALRAMDNDYEGAYIDDIVIGFAERGEMATDAAGNTDMAIDTSVSPPVIIEGAYQLEIRGAAAYTDGASSGPWQPPMLGLLRSFDTNDRLMQGVSLDARAGADVSDTQLVETSDGVKTIEYRFTAREFLDETNDTMLESFEANIVPGSDYSHFFGHGVIGDNPNLVGLLAGADVDLIAVDLQAQDRILIDVDTVPLTVPGELPPALAIKPIYLATIKDAWDPILRLFDANGVQVTGGFSDDNAGSNEDVLVDPYLAVIVPRSGRYYVGVSMAPNTAYSADTEGSGIPGVIDGYYEYEIDIQIGQWSVGDVMPVPYKPNDDPDRISDVLAQAINNERAYKQLDAIDVSVNSGDGDDSGNENTANRLNLNNINTTISEPTTIGELSDVLSQAWKTGITGGISDAFYADGVIGDNPNLAAEPGLDVDLLRLDLVAGDTLMVDVDAFQFGSSLDPFIFLFDDAGLRVAFSDNQFAPGELDYTLYNPLIPFLDPYLEYEVPESGTYYIGIGSAVNLTYDPLLPASGFAGRPGANDTTGEYSIDVVVGGAAPLLIIDESGDWNRRRNQGQIRIYANRITDSLEFGIVSGPGERDGDGLAPHQGPPRNLREINTERWAPGLTISNNVLIDNRQGGIRFSGSVGQVLYVAPPGDQITAGYSFTITDADGNPPLTFTIPDPAPFAGMPADQVAQVFAAQINSAAAINVTATATGGAFIDIANASSVTGLQTFSPQMGAVPFGRIVNNTIFGMSGSMLDPTGNDVGILIENNASPTLLNNVVANFQQGIQADASSATTVIGGALFQGNLNDSNIGLGDGYPIVLPNDAPLFVGYNSATRSFDRNVYLREYSLAIDSAVNTLLDRQRMDYINNPMGIELSPMLAPDRDVAGQLRSDDPFVETPSGVGENVFKDRGALDRVDFVGPTAVLIDPRDNDSEGNDRDPAATVVKLPNGVIEVIAIELIDGIEVAENIAGTGIDDLTVVTGNVVVTRDGELLTDGLEYTFDYDATNNTILLTSLSGIWVQGYTYVVTLVNVSNSGIADMAGNLLKPNQDQPSTVTQFTINLEPPRDYGDAPDPYPTLANADDETLDGASHVIVEGFHLGEYIDEDLDGQPNANADGDDLDNAGGIENDDDGVTFTTTLHPGAVSELNVNASASGLLDAWIDFNADGDWDDPGEQIFAGQQLFIGDNPASYEVPVEAIEGDTYARFRFSSAGGLSPTGPADDGEVEDYAVRIDPANPWHNPEITGSATLAGLDVNGDGFISPIDALIVINDLNANGGRILPVPPRAPLVPPPYLDVDNDGWVSPIDAIRVINYLNQSVGVPPSGEGEPSIAGDSILAYAGGMDLLATSTKLSTLADRSGRIDVRIDAGTTVKQIRADDVRVDPAPTRPAKRTTSRRMSVRDVVPKVAALDSVIAQMARESTGKSAERLEDLAILDLLGP